MGESEKNKTADQCILFTPWAPLCPKQVDDCTSEMAEATGTFSIILGSLG